MNFDELLKKYRSLLAENRQLKEKIKQLESQTESDSGNSNNKAKAVISYERETVKPDRNVEDFKNQLVTKHAPPGQKVNLFKSLFKGREEVFATRWENSKKGLSGYSPACGNEWVPGICQKPKIKCSACKNKDLTTWTETTKQLKAAGVHLIFKPNIHQKFAIIDQKIVWYGSINLLSYGNAEESMMRIESNNIAFELMGSLEKTA